MLLDYEQYLTPDTGQLFDAAAGASEYGSKSYDQKGAADAAVGGPLEAFYKVVDADVNTVTSLTIAIVADDDGAGTNEVVVTSKVVVLANLTKAKGVQRIGNIPQGTRKRHYRVKVTTTGSGPSTAGKIAVWLQKCGDGAPANAAYTI